MARLRRRSLPREPVRTVHAVVVARDPKVDAAQEGSPRGREPSGSGIGAPERPSGPSAVNVAHEHGAGAGVDVPTIEVNRASFFVAPNQMSTQELAIAGWAAYEPGSSGDVADAYDDAGIDGEVTVRAESTPVGDASPDAPRPASLGEPADDFTVVDDEDDPVPAAVDATTCTIAVWRGYRKA